ncbi:MAG: CYTH domain-containing protein [Gammaproteobacteria bacterium]|jgi:adenylate cyclase
MAIEIERKFLVKVDRLPRLENGLRIVQAYIPTANGTTVRVRLAGEKAYLGVKSVASGISRREYEYAIPMEDAQEMLREVCLAAAIEKQRFFFPQGEVTWEIDVFNGENNGLIVAEVELQSEGQLLTLPDWIAEEVTMDPRFGNHSLARNPYSTWE